ncbi:protein kinase domain-containing protein [Thalassotalea piscium]
MVFINGKRKRWYRQFISRPNGFNHQKLTELIDKGGMGSVYKAQRCDEQFEQTVAIKIIHSELEKIIGEHALIREAGFMAKLTHPNIGKVFDAGISDEGHHFIVMEYINGCTITEKFTEPTLTINEKLKIFCDLCDAVNHAHQMQVVHADLKPANILVTQDNQVKILDFGISRMFNSRSSDRSTAFTDYLKAMTASYASPELLAGENPNMYSDIYALGKIFSVLFIQQKTKETAYFGELEAIAKKATAEIYTQRYASVLELKNDITLFINKQVVKAFPASRLYKTKKRLFKRHPITTFLVATLIISITALSTNLFIQQQDLIKSNNESILLADTFSKLFELTDKDKTNGKNYTANDLLKNAIDIVNQTSELTPDSIAKLKLALARSNMSIREYEKADVLLLSIINDDENIQDKDIIYNTSLSLVKLLTITVSTEKIKPILSKFVDQNYINGVLDQRYSLAQLEFYIQYILGIYVIGSESVQSIFKSHRKNTIHFILNNYGDELTELDRAKYLYELGRTLYHDLPFLWIYSFEQTKDSIFDNKNAVDINEAIKLLKESLKMYRKYNVTDREYYLQSSIARYYIELDKYELAIPFLDGMEVILKNNDYNAINRMKGYFWLSELTYYDEPLKSMQQGSKALELAHIESKEVSANFLLIIADMELFHKYNSGELSNTTEQLNELINFYFSIPENERTIIVIETISFIIKEYLNYIDALAPKAKEIISLLSNDLIKNWSNDNSPYPKIFEETQTRLKGFSDLINEDNYLQGRILQLQKSIKVIDGNTREDNYHQQLNKVRLAWTLSLSGDNKAALAILEELSEFPWNKKEVRQSTMRLSVLLMKGHVYAKVGELEKAIIHLAEAKKLLGNIELNPNNAWQGKLLLLQGEILLAKGNIIKANDSLKKAKPAIEKHFPKNSLIYQHFQTLLKKVDKNTL